MSTFSQHMEDQFLWHYIINKSLVIPKSIIEIGACDGIHLSNSRFFLEKYWDGILVEPNDYYYPALQENYSHREDVHTVNAAITDSIGIVNFKKKMNAIDCSHVTSGEGSFEVESMTYRKLLEVCNWYKKEVGILSIDTEGFDTPILEQVLEYHLPYIIIIESNMPEERRKQIKLLMDEYDLIEVRSVNTIWIKKGLIKNCV